MQHFFRGFRENFTFWALSGFWLFDLLNPVFKKYDYGAEFPLVLVFGVLLTFVAVAEWSKKREKNWWEIGFLLVYGAAAVISFAFSQTRNVGFSEVLAYLSMIPLYLLLANQRVDFIKKFLKVVVIGASLAVVMGFVLYLVQPGNRMVGPFFNVLYHANLWPNAFALFLLMTWPVLLIFNLGKDKEISEKHNIFGGGKMFLRYFLLILFISALMLTFSRGALIVFGGQLLLLAIYFARRIKIRHVLMIVVIGVLAVGGFLLTNKLRALKYPVINVEQRISFANNEGLTSKKERQDFWAGAIELTKEKPWFGWGPYSFRYAYNPIQKDLLANADHPHNIFLKIAVENGMIALVGFLGFFLSIFVVVVRRWRGLEPESRDLIYVLSVAVVGAFAHDMIDYNLNFLANLLLLFVFIIFIRSTVVKEEKVVSKAGFGVVVAGILAVVIAGVSLYEGALLILDKIGNSSALSYSLYPRNHYPDEAERAGAEGDFTGAIEILDEEIKLNTLDSRAYNMLGINYCSRAQKDPKNGSENYGDCLNFLSKAIQLNPKNEFSFYVDYFRALNQDYFSKNLSQINAAKKELPKALELLDQYFPAVENNVHFTAYTKNVESAAELVDILTENFIEKTQELLVKKIKMLEVAKGLREKKSF